MEATAAVGSRPFKRQTYEHWVQWRTCTRKQYLPSEFVANNWLVLLELHYRDEFESGLAAYACRFCDGWHVGHPPK